MLIYARLIIPVGLAFIKLGESTVGMVMKATTMSSSRKTG